MYHDYDNNHYASLYYYYTLADLCSFFASLKKFLFATSTCCHRNFVYPQKLSNFILKMSSNSLISFLDEDKYNSERLLALKYIKERIERASTVQNILAPITPQDEFIFDVARATADNLSEVSELSDPFAELGENIIINAENKQKRRLSKVEADVLVMNSFPSTHMEIQNEIVAEMSLISQAPQLDVGRIMEDRSDDGDSDESEIIHQVACSLEEVGLRVYKEEKRKTESRQNESRQKQRPKKTKTQEEQDMEANSLLSGIWRMLGETRVRF